MKFADVCINLRNVIKIQILLGLMVVPVLAYSAQLPKRSEPKVIKTKMIWIDAEADVFTMSSRSTVRVILDKCSTAGINTIAVDVKPFSGFVLYDSKIAPKMTSFKGKPYPEKFDLLRVVTQEGHKRGMQVHAAINVFSEGLKAEKIGPVFAHPEWESVVYDVSYFIRGADGSEQMVSEVNRRDNDNTIVMYTPEYGKKVYPRDVADNAIDENTSSPSSKWVSNSLKGPHWLALEWTTPNKVDTIKLWFEQRHIIPRYRLQYSYNNQWVDIVKVTDNKDFKPIYSFLPINTNRVRLYIEDSGIDDTARLMEMGVYSVQGGTSMTNLAPEAEATSDSILGRGTTSTFYVVSNDTVMEAIDEESIDNDGLEIPAEGYVLSIDGKMRAWAKTALVDGEEITRGTKSRLVKETEYPGGMLVYVNPNNPEVRDRAISIIDEIVKNYNIDGIVLDRVRYDNFKVDFSDLSRRQFEQFIGVTCQRWPEDIYENIPGPKGSTIQQGKFYKEWLYWRASNIKDFIQQAKLTVKDIKPKVQFGDYVGSWYPSYYEVGVNWASSEYDPSEDYDWATRGYRGTGYSESLDYLSPGLYYPELTVADALSAGKKDYASLEGGINLVRKVVGNSTKIYAGLYYPNIASVETFKKAVKMSLQKTDGVMIFAMINFERENKWDLLKEALEETGD